MYVKNISQLFKEYLPQKLRFTEGTSIYGKIISQEGKNGLIKLYDGTIIPSIFLSENKLVNDKFIKFIIEEFNEEALFLKVMEDDMNPQSEDSINVLLKRLNIPKSEGTKIINSLIKFNLPATDENIMSIYKNMTFLDKLGKMADDEILSFLHGYMEGSFTPDSKEFNIAKEIFSKLLKVDTDFLSFLIENKIPYSLTNMLKSSDFIESKFGINNIIKALQNLLETDAKEAPISSGEILKELIDTPDLLPLLQDHLEDKIFPGSKAAHAAGDALTKFSNMNADYLSFLIENELPTVLEGMPEITNIIKDKSVINDIINILKGFLETSKTELFTFSFREIIKELVEKPGFLPLLRNYLDGKLALGSEDLKRAEEGFLKYSRLNGEYLTSLSKSTLSSLLSDTSVRPASTNDNVDIEKILNGIKSFLENPKKDLSILSFNNTVKEILDKPDILSLLPKGTLSSFTDNIEILKHLCNNYNIYFFNSGNNDNIYKNNIIIKNKYKSNSSIDPDDAKVFITVDTPNTGIVEAYLYKKGTDLTISIKADTKYIGAFKKSIGLLNKALINKSYNVINISVGPINPETNMVSLSNFFNDTIFQELDVRV